MTIYIAGPMTGLPEFNYPAFDLAARRLRAAGFDVESPTEHGLDTASREWHEWVRMALAQLIRCDGVALLPNWSTSSGAALEVNIACALKMPVRTLEEWLAAC